MKQALQYYYTIHSEDYDGPHLGYMTIVDLYGLSRETFRRRTTRDLKGYYGHLSRGKGNPKVLTLKQDEELAGHIGKFTQKGFAFNPVEIRNLAFEYPDSNNMQELSQIKKSVGCKRLSGLLHCHKQLMTVVHISRKICKSRSHYKFV